MELAIDDGNHGGHVELWDRDARIRNNHLAHNFPLDCENLSTLSLRYCIWVNDLVISCLSSSMINLRCLDISGKY